MSIACELAAPFVANSAVDGVDVIRPLRSHASTCLRCQARHAAMSKTARELIAMAGETTPAPPDLEWRLGDLGALTQEADSPHSRRCLDDRCDMDLAPARPSPDPTAVSEAVRLGTTGRRRLPSRAIDVWDTHAVSWKGDRVARFSFPRLEEDGDGSGGDDCRGSSSVDGVGLLCRSSH